MPAAWRLAINSFSRRRARTALLCACVALCAALIAAISCAIASLNAGLAQRIDETIGAADLRLLHSGKSSFDASVLKTVDSWPEVKLATGRVIDSVAFINLRDKKDLRCIAYGVYPEREQQLRPLDLSDGRTIKADGEIILEQRAAAELNARVGDTLGLLKLGAEGSFTVVGITRPPPLSSMLGSNSSVYMTAATLRKAAERGDILHEIDIVLKEGEIADAVVARHAAQLDPRLTLQPTARITAGFANNRQSSNIALIIASVFAFFAASFIIATGMTTGVTERIRELAILRCIGATRSQLVWTQLFTGAIIGLIGAIIGVPLGIVATAILVARFPDQLPGGFAYEVSGLLAAALGAVGSGVIGAAWSAWNAARVSPLQGLSSRSIVPRTRTILIFLAVALVFISIHATIVTLRPSNTEHFFWLYVPFAIPAMLSGYFLLSVPLTLGVTHLLARPLALILRVPHRLLTRSLRQNPFRLGFTAGSMMIGLSLLVAIWTNGRSVLDHWMGNLSFPDAFVTGLSMKPDIHERLRKVHGIDAACPITLHTLSTDAFGIKGLTRYTTTFIAFEPDPFFAMMNLQWIEGDPATAQRRLNEGGCVLVAREFLVTKGLGVGKTIMLKDPATGNAHTFEIVGVVASPGLEVASKFFEVGENYVDQAVSSVFGHRKDLINYFNDDAVNMVQLSFTPGADPDATMTSIMKIPGSGILTSGTAVWLKQRIATMLGGSMRIFSWVAVGAMVIASLGVANIIIAGVQARTFQFGVLRAIGAPRGLLGRLVMAEAATIGVAACVLGSALGLQAAWGGQNVTASTIGVELAVSPPLGPMALGCVAVLVITLAAAAPTALGLVRRPPRELLGVMRG